MDGESVEGFKVKPFKQEKMLQKRRRRGHKPYIVYYTFTNMSSCAGVKEMLLCACVFCASARVCVCYLYFVMLNLLILLGRHFLRWWHETAAMALSEKP